MTKVLYIIKGEHSDTSLSEEEEAKVMASQYVQIELIKEIARRTGCTSYFCDHWDESTANNFNGILERVANSSTDTEKDRIFEGLDNIVEKEGGGSDAIDTLKSFVELWEQGIHIRYKKTEDELDVLKLLKGNISDEDYTKAKRYIDAGNDPYNLYFSRICGPVLVRTRDSNIFRNIRSQAEDVNILFIGGAHQLEDFNNEPHEFKIFTVEVESNGGVTIKGNLPDSYKPFMDDLTGRRQLNNNLSYES